MKSVPITNVSTNLIFALLNNESIDEVFRSELENAVTEVLSAELTAFLGYAKYDYSGRKSGDSRNGFYDRKYQSRFGTLNIKIPKQQLFLRILTKISNAEPNIRNSFQTKILLNDMFAAFIATIIRQWGATYIKVSRNVALN